MLNKGSFIAEAIDILDDVLTRMEAHQLKKIPQLRSIHSW
jgi:pyruvate kinase